MRGNTIFIDEAPVGRYRKALNRHLKGVLRHDRLNGVDVGLNGSSNASNAVVIAGDDKGRHLTLGTFEKYAKEN